MCHLHILENTLSHHDGIGVDDLAGSPETIASETPATVLIKSIAACSREEEEKETCKGHYNYHQIGLLFLLLAENVVITRLLAAVEVALID